MNWQQLVTLAATVLGFGWVSAFIVQLIKRETWPSSVKLILSMVVAALVGLAAAWLTGDVTRFVRLWQAGGVTADQVVAFATLIYASANTWYRFYFSGTGWSASLGAWPKTKTVVVTKTDS
jgi:hypothetical protein